MKLPRAIRAWAVPLLVLLAASVAGPARGASTPPDSIDLGEMAFEDLMNVTVVYAASRYEQVAAEAPASVTVVTSDDIRAHGYRTLGEVLASTRGMYTTSDRTYEYVGVRGFGRLGDYNTRILVLVDGHRINENIYDGVDTESSIDLGLVDRIEVIRGPGSSIYGTNAFLAVVNVVTRPAADFTHGNITGAIGSNAGQDARAIWGNRWSNGVELLASATGRRTIGADVYFPEFDSPTTNHGVAQGADGQKAAGAFFKLSRGPLSLEGSSNYRDKSIPTGSYGTVFNDSRSDTKALRQFIEARYERTGPERIGVVSRMFLDYYAYDGLYVYDSGTPGNPSISLNQDLARGVWGGVETKIMGRLGPKHIALAGIEIRHNFRQEQEGYDESTVHLRDHRRSSVWALYAQDEYAATPWFRIHGGVRHDHYTTFRDATNFRIAGILTPIERTHVKLLYGSAFKAPNPFEVYYHDQVGFEAAPDLRPETIQTYELLVEQQLGPALTATGSIYSYRIKDLITQVAGPVDGHSGYTNAEGATARGIELELAGRWRHGLRGVTSYTWQNAEDSRTHEPIPNSPEHLAKFSVVAPLPVGNATFAPEVQFVGRRGTLAQREIPAYATANFTLATPLFAGRINATLSVYNAFDRSYGDPGAFEHVQDVIPREGRTWRVQLTTRL